jgi:hypothetical protein
MGEPATLDDFTVDVDKMSTKDEAARLLGILDTVAVELVEERDSDWRQSERLREVAKTLEVPYLVLWLVRDTYINNPSVTIEDIDELHAHPSAVTVFRKWVASTEALAAEKGGG